MKTKWAKGPLDPSPVIASSECHPDLGPEPRDTLDPPSFYPHIQSIPSPSHLFPKVLSTSLFLSIPPDTALNQASAPPTWASFLVSSHHHFSLWNPVPHTEARIIAFFFLFFFFFIFYCREFCRHKNREEHPEPHIPTAQPRSPST